MLDCELYTVGKRCENSMKCTLNNWVSLFVQKLTALVISLYHEWENSHVTTILKFKAFSYSHTFCPPPLCYGIVGSRLSSSSRRWYCLELFIDCHYKILFNISAYVCHWCKLQSKHSIPIISLVCVSVLRNKLRFLIQCAKWLPYSF